MSDFLQITTDNFKPQVLESLLPVILEFGAEWCGPCKQLEPVLKELGQEWAGKAVLAQVNVDQSADLATQHYVMGVPTVILYVKGEQVERFSGYRPKARIAASFKPHLGL